MRVVTVLLLAAVLLVAGCSSSAKPAAIRVPEPVKIIATPPAVKDGSLWQDDAAASASLTSDIKARGKGDLVTILVVEQVNATRTRSTATNRSQDATAAVEDVTVPYFGPVMGAAASVNGKNREFKVGMSSKRNSTGGGAVSDSGDVRATISAQVVEVLPNGNLVLLGTKEVSISGETQVVTLTGIARQKDITPDNTVYSTSLAEARVNISGSGPLDDAQRRTLVTRMFDWVNLF